jgi:succinoglycan biosynthesis protein ExoM
MTPTLSVVTPTYRRPALLDALLEAAMPQLEEAGQQAEMVIVDNCPDASAAPVLERHAAPNLHYVHEPRPGVVHARNTGVQASSGACILFLDDDEIPLAGWLAAFRAAAERGDRIAIGRIVPRYAIPAPVHLADLLRRLYARDSNAPAGADVAASIRLGTGNTMFRRDLFDSPTPFDHRFNRSGGEDSFLIKGLLSRGERVIWVPDGAVEEVVPADRMSADYLGQRRFTQGQLRCVLIDAAGGPTRLPRLVIWMTVGLGQVLLYHGGGLLARFKGRETETWSIKAHGGLGKLYWRRRAMALSYATETSTSTVTPPPAGALDTQNGN